MKRLFAVAGAAAMVAAALAIRGAFDDGDGDGNGRGGGSADGLTVACPSELESACRTAFGDDAVVEEAELTLDRFASSDGPGDLDAWVVDRAWADVLVSDHPGSFEEIEPIAARSPLLLAVWTDRAALLDDTACEGRLDLVCLGQVAGRTFAEVGAPSAPEQVRVGHRDMSSTTGLTAVAAAASAFLERDDYAANDFTVDFRNFLGDLEQDVSGPNDPFPQMLAQGPAFLTAVIGLEAELAPLAAANTRDPVELRSVGATADLVVVSVRGEGGGIANDDDLLDGLAQSGWRVLGRGLPPDAVDVDVPLEGGKFVNGLAVKPDVLAALRTLASEVSS